MKSFPDKKREAVHYQQNKLQEILKGLLQDKERKRKRERNMVIKNKMAIKSTYQ